MKDRAQVSPLAPRARSKAAQEAANVAWASTASANEASSNAGLWRKNCASFEAKARAAGTSRRGSRSTVAGKNVALRITETAPKAHAAIAQAAARKGPSIA